MSNSTCGKGPFGFFTMSQGGKSITSRNWPSMAGACVVPLMLKFSWETTLK